MDRGKWKTFMCQEEASQRVIEDDGLFFPFPRDESPILLCLTYPSPRDSENLMNSPAFSILTPANG